MFVSRKRYDALLVAHPEWMATVWPKLRKTWNEVGAWVYNGKDELKAKLVGVPS